MNKVKIERILIYRHGSLGDTVVALPCFHAIAKAFPQAKRYVLTSFTINSKACAIAHVLGNSNLVDNYIAYPAGVSLFKKFYLMRKVIKEYQPDLVIYLTESRTVFSTWRDYFSFKLFGVKNIVGVPLKKDLRRHRYNIKKKAYESEAVRLTRSLEKLVGKIDLKCRDNWNLKLTVAEFEKSEACLAEVTRPVIVCSIGTKRREKDWGERNWQALIVKLSARYATDCALIFIGVDNEHERSQILLDKWQGEKLNLCGELSVRETAALMSKARLFIGHDSGPMHLAASQKTPCVAIFSRRDPPGIWFPFGEEHCVLYPTGKDIFSILVDDVLNGVRQLMSRFT